MKFPNGVSLYSWAIIKLKESNWCQSKQLFDVIPAKLVFDLIGESKSN